MLQLPNGEAGCYGRNDTVLLMPDFDVLYYTRLCRNRVPVFVAYTYADWFRTFLADKTSVFRP